MSLIVEDGSGKAAAETYISKEDADTYHAARGNDSWATITIAQKEQALRRATEYMIQAFTARWQGERTYPLVQALDWPRAGVIVNGVSVDYDAVPETIKRATAELAIRAAAGPLLNDMEQGVVSETVGPIQTVYDKNSNRKVKYAAIDAMLLPYLKSGGGASVGLVRS